MCLLFNWVFFILAGAQESDLCPWALFSLFFFAAYRDFPVKTLVKITTHFTRLSTHFMTSVSRSVINVAIDSLHFVYFGIRANWVSTFLKLSGKSSKRSPVMYYHTSVGRPGVSV